MFSPNSGKSRILRRTALGGLGLATVISSLLAGTSGLQNAVANGDTRTLSFYHAHTREKLTVTFRRNGRYDSAELQKLNWFLRDWRNNDTVAMDPKLFDIVWAAQREAGSTGTIKVLSAYRSPKTNAMLRRRSSAVAKNSQHMVGKALDFQLPDADMSLVRNIGMRLQRGGVGYYANVPFVHLDSGSVRSWPRMPRAQLARLFPDGRTVHVPAEGTPLAGFEAAKQMLLARGDSVPGFSAAAYTETSRQPERRKSLWAALFGGGDEEEDAAEIADTSRRQVVASAPRDRTQATYDNDGEDDSDPRRFFVRNNASAARGRVQPAAPVAPAPQPVIAPEPIIAAAEAPARPVLAPAPVPAAAPVPRPDAGPTIVAFADQIQAMGQAPVRGNAFGGKAFDGPMPVARPGSQVPGSVKPADNAVLAMLPQPPRRPGQAAPAIDAVGIAANAGLMQVAAIPVPPLRPAELAPAGDRNALAAIAAASREWDGDDRSIRSRALAYTSEPEILPPPVPPMRPAFSHQAQMSPSLPAKTQQDARHSLNQLFAMVETDAKPSPKAKVNTARVVASQPIERVAMSMPAAAPEVVVQMGFSKDVGASDLKTDSFTGPAVKPLPVARFSK